MKKVSALIFSLTLLFASMFHSVLPTRVTYAQSRDVVTTGPKLYIGLVTGEVKYWDAPGNKWVSLGDQGATIYESIVFDGKLFFGFSDGTVKAYNKSAFLSFGDAGNGITGMEVYKGKLYVSQCLGVNGEPNGQVKRLDGSTWTSLGSQGMCLGSLKTYTASNGVSKLYAGDSSGCFKSYDGTVWKQAGCFLANNAIQNMEVYGGKLYLGLASPEGKIYSYDGVTGGVLYQGSLGAGVRAMKVYNNKLYASGLYAPVGGPTEARIFAQENGNWVLKGTVADNSVDSMIVYNSKLHTVDYSGVVRSYNGTSWSTYKDAGPGAYTINSY